MFEFADMRETSLLCFLFHLFAAKLNRDQVLDISHERTITYLPSKDVATAIYWIVASGALRMLRVDSSMEDLASKASIWLSLKIQTR